MIPRIVSCVCRLALAPLVLSMLASCASHKGAIPEGRERQSLFSKLGEERPVPKPRLEEGSWISFDGERFPFTRWGTRSPQRVIVAVHGLSGAASDFEDLGEHFEGGSTSVYGYELRGQGLDPVAERIGDIKSPELWYSDLDTFLELVRSAHPDARLYLYGESLGGLIALHAMEQMSPDNQRAIAGMIFASPVVSLKDRKRLSRLKYFALKAAIKIMPRRKVSLEQLAGDDKDMRITSDTDHFEHLDETPHAVDRYSLRLLGTVERLIDGSHERVRGTTKPVLVLYPANDLLTTAEEVEAWYAKIGSQDKEKQLFAESYHLLLHDKESERVLERIRDWLDRH